MSTVELGKAPTAMNRDAIHLAVLPIAAGEPLLPGEKVGIQNEVAIKKTTHLGIVDPFRTGLINQGEIFYLCLFPNTVNGMRHHWSHPLLADVLEKGTSELWLRKYAMEMNCYDDPPEAFERLIDGLRSGELLAHGSDLHCLNDLEDSGELKRHAELYLGTAIDWATFEFRCSC